MAGFFDKMVVGLNEGYNTAKEAPKFLVEKAKLSTQIKDAEQDKNQLLQNMGTLIYNLHMNGKIQIEQCLDMCNEVSVFEKKIHELQQQLQIMETQKGHPAQNTQFAVNNGTACECGYVNKKGAKFCSKCGNPLEPIANE